MKTYEYDCRLVRVMPSDEFVQRLNDYGDVGWQVVGMLMSPDRTEMLVYFMREKQ